MIREVTEFFLLTAGTGDARLGKLKSPWAESGREGLVPLAAFAKWMGSMLGDPRKGGSCDDDGRRKEPNELETSMRWLMASTWAAS